MHAALEFVLEQMLGIWRFRGTAMLMAWIACVLGWLVVLALPDIYSAWTRVYIDTHTRIVQVTKDIGVEPNVAERAEIVREALLGGPQLIDVGDGHVDVVNHVGYPPRKSSPRCREIVFHFRSCLQLPLNHRRAADQVGAASSVKIHGKKRDDRKKCDCQQYYLQQINTIRTHRSHPRLDRVTS